MHRPDIIIQLKLTNIGNVSAISMLSFFDLFVCLCRVI